jgi:hypothetical protein
MSAAESGGERRRAAERDRMRHKACVRSRQIASDRVRSRQNACDRDVTERVRQNASECVSEVKVRGVMLRKGVSTQSQQRFSHFYYYRKQNWKKKPVDHESKKRTDCVLGSETGVCKGSCLFFYISRFIGVFGVNEMGHGCFLSQKT